MSLCLLGRRRRPRAWLLLLPLAACAPRVAAPPSPSGSDSVASEPTVRAWPVMGTLLEIAVWEADSTRAHDALRAARAAVFRVDTLMSVYKPESDLSVVNRRAGTDTVTVVDPETAYVLAEAVRFEELSGGALDVTVGPLVDAWGFYRHEGRIPPPAVLDSASALVGIQRLEWDPARRKVRLPRRGMRLDFGAIAKGYAVDQGIEALRSAGIRSGRVDLGGNLRVFGTPPNGGGWEVGLRDPRAPDEAFAVALLDSGAVATSGDYEQFFVHDDVRYSHIFDPRTGWPARGTAGGSVVAATALEADALSTALVVLGADAGCRLVSRLPGVDAVWVGDVDHPTRPADLVFSAGLGARMILLDPSGAEQSAARPCDSAETRPRTDPAPAKGTAWFLLDFAA